MDFTKLHWNSDFMRSEIYGECDSEEDFVIGIYTLIDFPEITLYINVEEGKIIEVFLDEE